MKAMNIDINKIVHLELRNNHGKKFSNTRLKFIADFLSIDFDFLVDLSEKYKKIWFISIDNTTHLVYALTADIYESAYSFKPFNLDYANVRDIKAVEVPKTPAQTKKAKVVKTNEVSNIFIEDLIGDVEDLDVDTILDKISATGMASLTKREVEFLNNLSK
jgi:hypothetical protein